jgi:hypothetical protein
MPNNEKLKTANDPDGSKGAVEQNSPDDATNLNFEGQLPHRTENSLIKSNDTDFPEPGENPEHSGEPEQGDTAPNPNRAA